MWKEVRHHHTGPGPHQDAGLLNESGSLHCLVLDGVYVGERPEFRRAPPLTDAAIAQVAERLAKRTSNLLNGNDHLEEGSEDPDALGQLQTASLFGRVVVGERAGRSIRRVGGEAEPYVLEGPGRLCANVEGLKRSRGRACRIERARGAGTPVPIRVESADASTTRAVGVRAYEPLHF